VILPRSGGTVNPDRDLESVTVYEGLCALCVSAVDFTLARRSRRPQPRHTAAACAPVALAPGNFAAEDRSKAHSMMTRTPTSAQL
jgi:hypothetical protein